MNLCGFSGTLSLSHTTPATRRIIALVIGLSALTLTDNVHAQLGAQVLSSGFSFPTHVAAPAGDSIRLFVTERAGRIRIFNRQTSVILPAPFLDISSKVSLGGEGGLYSVAFHPAYAQNGIFFVFYTTDIDSGSGFNLGSRVSRFVVSGDANVADAASETVFLELDKPSEFHNGGMLAFRPGDPDHSLYISTGDGGSGCDPGERAQNLNLKYGKLLRINVDAGPGPNASQPLVPASNPFVGVAGDDAVWDYGLRNPYRFSFDRVTGDLWIGDVGQITREEINFEAASSPGGRNYGWDAMEGSGPTVGCFTVAPVLPGMISPVIDYLHNGEAAAVTGGYVYRGAAYPTLQGRYFYADFALGNIWSFLPVNGAVTDHQDHTGALGLDLTGLTSFGEGGDAELFYVNFQGMLVRIVDTPADNDQDLLSNDVEDDGGIFVSPTLTGTDPGDPDSDDDGVMDGIEVSLGTDPNNPLDFPELPAAWLWAVGAATAALLAAGARYIRQQVRKP